MTYQVEYNTADKDGETRAERNERFGVETPAFEDAGYDGSGDHIITLFWRVSGLRSYNFSGPDPLRPETVLGWLQVSGDKLSRDELMILFDMDAAYLRAHHNLSREQQKKSEAEHQQRMAQTKFRRR